MARRTYSHVELLFGGALPSGERWSCGFTLAQLPVTTALFSSPSELDTFANSAATDVGTWITTASSGNKLGAAVTTDQVRAYFRPANQTAALQVSVAATAHTGTGTVIHPNQIALVCTLRTAFAGRSNRGRIYLPCLAAPLALGSTDCSQVGSGISTLITSLNTHASSAFGEAVGVVVGTAGAKVTAVRVDNVYDTQRRRRNKIVPTQIIDTLVV